MAAVVPRTGAEVRGAVIVDRLADGTVRVPEAVNIPAGRSAAPRRLIGLLIGLLVGILGGPLGMPMGWSIGALTGRGRRGRYSPRTRDDSPKCGNSGDGQVRHHPRRVMAEQKSTQNLPQPLRAAASVLSRVPGAGMVGRAAEGTLDKVGAVSPRGRRIAVYTGAGVLGVAGIVEWPVAITGAAVAYLTQPRREETEERTEAATATGGTRPTPQVLASSSGRPSAEGAESPATPSDRLPTASPESSGSSGSRGPGGSTTARPARTNG